MRGPSWLIRSGRSGSVATSVIALRSAVALVLLHGRLDGAAHVVWAELEEHQPGVELGQLEQVLGQPVEPVELDGRGVEELRAGVRVAARGALEQLDERAHRRDRRPELVADVREEVPAAVPVAPDDLDALLEAARHRVELVGELLELERAGLLLGVDPGPEVALAEPSRRLGQARDRRREAVRHERGHEHRHHERRQRHDEQQAGDRRQGGRPAGVRVGQRDLDPPVLDGVRAGPRPGGPA